MTVETPTLFRRMQTWLAVLLAITALTLVACNTGDSADSDDAADDTTAAETTDDASADDAAADEEPMDEADMAAENSTLRFGNFNPNYASNFLPELGDHFGWLADGGITELEMTFADQSTLFPGLLGGSLDIVAQDTDAVAGAHAAGETDFVTIAIYRAKEPWILAFRNGVSVDNLEGVTCSGGGAGGRNEFNAREMIARLGGNPDDVEWIPIGGGSDARVNAFAQGQIDCVQHFDRHRELVANADGYIAYDELEDVPQDGFVVLRSWAEENPRTVINFLKAAIQARAFVMDIDNKDEIIEIMRGREYDIPPEFVDQYERALAIIGQNGHFSIESMETLIEDSVRTGSLTEYVDWRDFTDMSYLNQAYAELGMDELVKDYSAPEGDAMPVDMGEPAENDTLRFGNFNPNYASNFLPELGDHFGWLADGGITDLEMTFADQSTLFPGLLGGSLDIVAQDTDAVAGAHAAGETDFITIAIYRAKEPWILSFRNGITVDNLEGVQCSGGGAGGRNEFNAREMIARLGGDPDDIEWIPIGGGSDARVNAFAQGQIDCVQHFDRHRELVAEADGYIVYDELEDVPQDGFVVLRSWAEENPRTVINFLKAAIQARAFVMDIDNKDEIIEIMQSREYDIPPEFVAQYERALAIIGQNGHFSIESMETLIADSVRTGSLTEYVDWRQFTDMSYLNQAYAELGMDDLVKDYDAPEASMPEEEPMPVIEGEPAENDTLRFGNFNPNYASNFVPELGDHFGWLADGGITELEMTFADQSTLFPGLLGGSLDIVAQDTDAVAGAHAAGETDFITVAIYRAKEPWILSFRNGITVDNLEGVQCSGGGAGGRNEFNAREMIARLGGDPEQVEWIPIGGGSDARVNAFAQGQIDCVQHFDRHRELVAAADGYIAYDELEDVPQDGFVVLRSWAEENPRTVVNFLKAAIQARAFVMDIDNKDEIIEIMQSREYDIPPEFVAQYERALAIIGQDGHFDIESMETLIEDSVRTGSLTEYVDWRDFTDMSYLNQAYLELGMPEMVREYE